MSRQYGFARIADSKVIGLLNAIAALHPQGQAVFNLIDHISVTVQSGSEVSGEWSSFLTDHSYLIKSATATVSAAGLTVYYHRGQIYFSENGNLGWRPSPNPYIDGIEIQGPSQDPSGYGPDVLAILNNFLQMAPPLEVAEISSSSVQKSEMILDRMSSVVATLTEEAGAAYAKLNERRTEIERQGDESLAERKAALDKAFEASQAELEEQRRVLDSKLAEIDANDNTFTRRGIAANMRKFTTDTLEKTLLSRSNHALLFPVVGSLIGMCAAGLLTYFSAKSLVESLGQPAASTVAAPGGVYYFMEARTLALGALTATLLWSALRQLNARYLHISKWENDLNRFRLDTERASFLVEADLEARKLNGQPLAQVVLESFSRGLFGASGDSDSAGTDGVGTALNTILNRPASLKVSGNGVEVTVDKAGLAKARKEIDKED